MPQGPPRDTQTSLCCHLWSRLSKPLCVTHFHWVIVFYFFLSSPFLSSFLLFSLSFWIFSIPFRRFSRTLFFFSSLFFIYRLVLSFPVSRIAGLIQYLAFSHWLLSPSNMHLPFLHVFSRLASFFLVLNNNPPVRMDHSVSVHHLVRDTLTASQCCSDAYRCCKHL